MKETKSMRSKLFYLQIRWTVFAPHHVCRTDGFHRHKTKVKSISIGWLFWGKGVLILPCSQSDISVSSRSHKASCVPPAAGTGFIISAEKSHDVHEVTQSKSEDDTIKWTVWAFVQPMMVTTLCFWWLSARKSTVWSKWLITPSDKRSRHNKISIYF